MIVNTIEDLTAVGVAVGIEGVGLLAGRLFRAEDQVLGHKSDLYRAGFYGRSISLQSWS